MRKHNFYAGPARLSNYVIQKTAAAVLDFEGTGLSVMGISHRSKEFIGTMTQATELARELLDIPSDYSIVFIQGGASLQFCMVPFNLMDKKAAYVNTGSWSSKAIKEAKFFGDVVEVASSKDDNFSYIPKGFESEVPNDASYLHITTNNTIFGTQYRTDPDVNIPLTADMSSDIFSRPIDVRKYAAFYAGAQKNIGPSGITMVVVKNDLLGKVDRPIPTYLDYRTHVDKESMFNTPPTVAVYACLQTLKRFKDMGGVVEIQKKNIEKAQVLYDEIDRNPLFKGNVKNEEDRSVMNVTFIMNDEYKELEKNFLTFIEDKNIVGVKGHRSVGGFRASIYNAQPLESIQTLVAAMKEFERIQ